MTDKRIHLEPGAGAPVAWLIALAVGLAVCLAAVLAAEVVL